MQEMPKSVKLCNLITFAKTNFQISKLLSVEEKNFINFELKLV